MEAAYGLGNIIGPPMASKFYGAYGYQYTFYAFASLELLNILSILTLREDKFSKVDRSSLLSVHSLRFKEIGANKATIFTYVGIIFAWFNVSYYLSFLSFRLLDLGVSDDNIGNCFIALTAPYFVSCFTLPTLLKGVKKKH